MPQESGPRVICTLQAPRALPQQPRRSRLAMLSAAAAVTAAASLALAPAAHAQGRGHYSTDPNVTVDLSVLGGPTDDTISVSPLPQRPPAQSELRPELHEPMAETTDGVVHMPSELLFPPSRPPRSRLVGPYADLPVPQLRRPTPAPQARASTAAPQSRLTAPAPRSPVPPAPAPAMPERAATPPAPQTAARQAPPPAPPPPPQPKAAEAPRPTAPVPPPPSLPEPTAPPAPAITTPEPVTPPAAAQPETAKPVETAAVPPKSAPPPPETSDTQVRVLFDSGSAKLPNASRAALQTLATRLDENEQLRLQIEAYAEGTSETASQARRLSLSRALAVRAYLIEQGVRSTRMDVRALGNKQTDPPAPPDRVDARLIER